MLILLSHMVWIHDFTAVWAVKDNSARKAHKCRTGIISAKQVKQNVLLYWIVPVVICGYTWTRLSSFLPHKDFGKNRQQNMTRKGVNLFLQFLLKSKCLLITEILCHYLDFAFGHFSQKITSQEMFHCDINAFFVAWCLFVMRMRCNRYYLNLTYCQEQHCNTAHSSSTMMQLERLNWLRPWHVFSGKLKDTTCPRPESSIFLTQQSTWPSQLITGGLLWPSSSCSCCCFKSLAMRWPQWRQ